MRWLFLIGGGLATAAMLAISMRLNFLFGFSLGQTPERAWVFGCVSLISDAWKGLGPIFILVLLRERRWAPALATVSIWIVCFVYSVTSALGIAVEDRTSRTSARETLQINYAEAKGEIERLEHMRKNLREHRSASEVEAAVIAVLARAVESKQRTRGTVGSVSRDCERTDVRTVEACAEVSRLREELAAAIEERDLNVRLAALTEQAREWRERGAVRAADPQAELLARLSRGWLAVADVGPTLSMLLAVMIELVSAFGPAVLSAYAETTKRVREHDAFARPGSVVDYLIERVEPAAPRAALRVHDLFADYQAWCLERRRHSLALPNFISALDSAREENGLRKIRKRKDRYYGIRIASLSRQL